MNAIHEIQRLDAPVNLPQSLTWDGTHLWMGSLDTRSIYKIDTQPWEVVWTTEAPGIPWGMIWTNEELRVICGETDEDNRIIRRCIPSHGFDTQYKLPCPEDTGSQLGWNGGSLQVSQWYNKLILAVKENGEIIRKIPVHRGICGQVFVENTIYFINTDAEETNEYYLSKIDLNDPEFNAQDIATIPFGARALAFDDKNFWTNDRQNNQIVRFTKPD